VKIHLREFIVFNAEFHMILALVKMHSLKGEIM